jgi:SPP1 gp7 family putative phage head morphogenesis protein
MRKTLTAQTLIDQINRIINAEYALLDRTVRQNLLGVRKSVMAGAQSMWDKVDIEPVLNPTTGNVAYVSRTEAFKYGRFEKLTAEVKGAVRVGMVTDIRNLESNGKRIYEAQYNGMAWVYNQGYALPVTGGVKVPLIANALYSDFYGDTFDHLLRKNWSVFADDIMAQLTRELNQGHSYTKMAKSVQTLTNRQYANSLRVARTEAHRIQAMAIQDSYKLLDEVGAEYRKMWVATIDDRTRDTHVDMDGELADENGIFSLSSGATGPGPGLTGEASEDINCRCTDIAIIDGEKPTERRIRGEGIVPYEAYKERLGATTMTEIREARKSL